MTSPVFYDGIGADANRTNEASGRSWHIPAPTRRGFYGIVAVQLIVCALPVGLIWAIWS